MPIEWFLSIKSLPNLLFGVLCLPGDQSHPFAQPTINPLACCICWAGLLGRMVFPSWNEGPNFGSYNLEVKSIFLVGAGQHVNTVVPKCTILPQKCKDSNNKAKKKTYFFQLLESRKSYNYNFSLFPKHV